ncbi:exodeoxyribonuclease VII small subunit [Halioglobus maricola]|uniref:Exodeoxyribonuclease 7 small subunit n=1 Tax=Halioglobus maricola TaxID=2601894 RepID=A0A5P9NGK9_9GAMM|nr:exodeoxyribonuclease VII small subunit [Halioglobus maricola]QFU74679.1 exodeoxyribonuclease VII small subunit [Halioglobus maricola]
MSNKNTQDHAALLSRLSELITVLEDSDTNVESALDAFEEGIKVSRAAQSLLTKAEQRVKSLVEVDEDAHDEP